MAAVYAGLRGKVFAKSLMVDGRMKWPSGLALGRLALIYAESQNLGVCEARAGDLNVWARLTDQDEAMRFIAELCGSDIDLLAPTLHDTFVIVGNESELDKIAKQKAKSSSGGKAGGKGRPRRQPEANDRQTTGQPGVSPRSRSRLHARNIHSPYTPLSRRELNRRADEAALDALGALHRNVSDGSEISSGAAALASAKYGSWERTRQAFASAIRSNNLTGFEHGLRRDFRAAAPKHLGSENEAH